MIKEEWYLNRPSFSLIMYLHINYFWRRLHFDILINSIRPEFLHENGYLWVRRTTTETTCISVTNYLPGIPTQPWDIWISILSSSDHQLPCWIASLYWAPRWNHWRTCTPPWLPGCWWRWPDSGPGSPPRTASLPPRYTEYQPHRSLSAGRQSWKTKISIQEITFIFCIYFVLFSCESIPNNCLVSHQNSTLLSGYQDYAKFAFGLVCKKSVYHLEMR